MRHGRYIVIEGNEGSGKTTQKELLVSHLVAAGYHVESVREPAGDAVGRTIRKILLDPQYDIDSRTEVLLFNAARAGLMRQISGLLERGIWCVADRNFLSTLAYQVYGRNDGLLLRQVEAICEFAVGDCPPDMTVVLDVPTEVLATRRQVRGNGDRFENLDPGFYERVRTGYREQAKRLKMPVLEANRPIETVAEEIWQLVEPLILGGVHGAKSVHTQN